MFQYSIEITRKGEEFEDKHHILAGTQSVLTMESEIFLDSVAYYVTSIRSGLTTLDIDIKSSSSILTETQKEKIKGIVVLVVGTFEAKYKNQPISAQSAKPTKDDLNDRQAYYERLLSCSKIPPKTEKTKPKELPKLISAAEEGIEKRCDRLLKLIEGAKETLENLLRCKQSLSRAAKQALKEIENKKTPLFLDVEKNQFGLEKKAAIETALQDLDTLLTKLSPPPPLSAVAIDVAEQPSPLATPAPPSSPIATIVGLFRYNPYNKTGKDTISIPSPASGRG